MIKTLLRSACTGLILALGANGAIAQGQPPTAADDLTMIVPCETATTTCLDTYAKAARFAARTSFGATIDEIKDLRGEDAAELLQQQFSKPLSPPLLDDTSLANFDNYSKSRRNREIHELFWKNFLSSDDQLRMRMTFALSQIVVIGADHEFEVTHLHHHDNLYKNAFGKYRQLLDDVTYSLAMARWLTYLNSEKADPDNGIFPDENYAREILQLFTVGLFKLKPNGEPDLINGNFVELYDNDDIVNLARVFTGFRRRAGGDPLDRLVIQASNHSNLEKNFLDIAIPAGTPGEASVTQALDGIFNHDNVPPFIARQLIQRFTASHPDPAYVGRVATAFKTGTFTSGSYTFGDGTRGNLEATLAAIHLEPALFNNTSAISTSKIQEPLLGFTRWARAFVKPANRTTNGIFELNDTSRIDALQQMYMRSPSVFNFYRPGYVAPGTEAGKLKYTTPEFQLADTMSFYGYANFMTKLISNAARRTCSNCRSLRPDYKSLKEIYNIEGINNLPVNMRVGEINNYTDNLIDHLDIFLTGGRMEESEKTDIANAVNSLTEIGNDASGLIGYRINLALIMTFTSPSYLILN